LAIEKHVLLDSSSGADRVIRCVGSWTSATASTLESELSPALSRLPGTGIIVLNINKIEQLDTIGAWVLTRFRREMSAKGGETVLEGGTPQHHRLLDRIGASVVAEPKIRRHEPKLIAPFIALGRLVTETFRDIFAANAVQGRIISAFGRTLMLQAPLRFPSFVHQFELIVLRAIPIVLLISVVVGAIITQQTILQLRTFGATILVVDLAAVLMFREIGVLLAAIMVAGRSGSAITAELGSMRMREEFDALRVMGVDPYQALLLPRVVALVLGLPLLAFIAGMAGLVGAALVSRFYGDIPINLFIDRLRSNMMPASLVVGLIKAPFMAFLVGLVASIEGMKVEGSTESLGHHTTASVVKSIFLVILADGLFAMFFAAIKV
jgi:phospholipid/cholesterol/gamma-HCH transport system permease protein